MKVGGFLHYWRCHQRFLETVSPNHGTLQMSKSTKNMLQISNSISCGFNPDSFWIDLRKPLLEKSNFFKKGVFNHTQASDIATQLDKNGFFGVNVQTNNTYSSFTTQLD
jgi:hypothetical protein